MKALINYKTAFDQYLEEQTFQREPKTLYAPFNYILQLGGKRVRPTCLLAANDLFGGRLQDALPAAMAIELFHNFTLIHDDIMDVADLRRGKPTVHKQFDENTAILSGDVMFAVAYDYLMNSLVGFQGLKLFNQTAIEVCEGQQYDMDFETRDDVSVDQYIAMIRLKTAVLLGCSLQLGALGAGANQEEQEHIYQYGTNLGISFQIMDDVLDAFGDAATFGKKVGGDILQNKKTILLIRAKERCVGAQADELNHWLTVQQFDETEKVNAVKKIYQDCGVVDEATQLAEDYYKDSLSHLHAIEKNTSILEDFSAQLLKRNQ